MTNTTGNESASETDNTSAVRDTAEGTRHQTITGTIRGLFRQAINGITGRAAGKRTPHMSGRHSTETARYFLKVARKITSRRGVLASLPSIARRKNNIMMLAKAAGHMMTHLVHDVERALGLRMIHERIDHRGAARQHTIRVSDEKQRYGNFVEQLPLLTEKRGAARPNSMPDKPSGRF